VIDQIVDGQGVERASTTIALATPVRQRTLPLAAGLIPGSELRR
jgi:hypothetical protein